MKPTDKFDVIIVGSGVSGSNLAQELTRAGKRCLMLEAGTFFNRDTFPDNEMDGTAQLYWNGGIEINTDATIAMLRPKVVGGGTIVNQALVDRFYPEVLEEWKQESEIDYFEESALAPWYKKAESNICIQQIPEQHWNRNSRIFKEGFEKNGFKCAPLDRAQKNCFYQDRNDCVTCLNGCRLDSKQSTPITTLKRAIESGLEVRANFEVTHFKRDSKTLSVFGNQKGKAPESFETKDLVLAAGAMGNTKLLFRSDFGRELPALGNKFFTHPQNMVLARYSEPVNSHKGPFQTVKSEEPLFRQQGFKLENVFTQPGSFAMLMPGHGSLHQARMAQMNHFACMEVAVRDTQRGTLRLDRKGKLQIKKYLNTEDQKRMRLGLEAIDKIFKAAGAKEVIPSRFNIGLHLMGGCSIGKEKRINVVDPDFRIHGQKNIYVADSSIFPTAPGINPSLTIMALSLKAAQNILEAA